MAERPRAPRGRHDGSGRQRPREESITHADYRGQNPGYEHGTRGDSVWDRAARLATMAPVHGNPTMDPAGTMLGPALMCGYDPGHPLGYDSLRGPARMAVGRRDARRELEVESATEGGPLELSAGESPFADDIGAGTHDLMLDAHESGRAIDHMSAFRLRRSEPEAGGN